MQLEMVKRLYIIAGCNGAGKTTASYTVLPKILDCQEFVNADEIAHGLSPFNPNSVAIEAGKLMIQRIHELLDKGETFAIETTLATKSYIHLVHQAQARGYCVSLLFFWLRDPSLAIQRVSERVQNGGHSIPRDVIVRRYIAGIQNLFNMYINIVDSWNIYDNSINPRRKIAVGGRLVRTEIFDCEIFKQIKNYV